MNNQIITISKIVGEQQKQQELRKDRREGKGRVLALSRRIYRLQNRTESIFYVESESSDNTYYFVKFKPDVLEYWCSCKDNSTRHTIKCKHLFAIEFAIKWGTIKDIDKIPNIADQSTSNNIAGTNPVELVTKRRTKSYLEDDYDF